MKAAGIGMNKRKGEERESIGTKVSAEASNEVACKTTMQVNKSTKAMS